MELMTIRVFDIGEVDELSKQSNIVSVYNLYYDALIDKVMEVIVLFNTDFNDIKVLMYHEDIKEGAIEMESFFLDELNTAKLKGEVVLLDGDEDLANSLVNFKGRFINTLDTEKKEQ